MIGKVNWDDGSSLPRSSLTLHPFVLVSSTVTAKEPFNMEYLHQYIEYTVSDWRTLLINYPLTPKLREQIISGINVYLETSKEQTSKVEATIDHLDAIKSTIESRWKMLFTNMGFLARLLQQIGIFQEFLKFKLLEDYGKDKPYTVDERVICLGRFKGGLSDRERAAQEVGVRQDELDDLYEERVVFVLKELMFDRAHVESKMRTALARDGQPGSDVQPMIDRHDWASLAATLLKDEVLAIRLFQQDNDLGKKVQRGIKRTREKYFSELVNPNNFVISKSANLLMAKVPRSVVGETILDHPAGPPPPYSVQKTGPDSCHQHRETKEHEGVLIAGL